MYPSLLYLILPLGLDTWFCLYCDLIGILLECDMSAAQLKEYFFPSAVLTPFLVSSVCLHSLPSLHSNANILPPSSSFSSPWHHDTTWHFPEMATPGSWTSLSLFILLDLCQVHGMIDLSPAADSFLGFHYDHSLLFPLSKKALFLILLYWPLLADPIFAWRSRGCSSLSTYFPKWGEVPLCSYGFNYQEKSATPKCTSTSVPPSLMGKAREYHAARVI